ncbi:MAG TPA: nodulation protein NfeD [Steroidobacteraceae bacterium]|nr:nodulation protein NfeD [Steroidobacteraceae bacterium]
MRTGPALRTARLAGLATAAVVLAAIAGAIGANPPDAAAGTDGATSSVATVLEINGAIGPATARYVVKGIQDAQAGGSRVVVLRIDTPGGLDTSMRDIIRAILAAPLPVVSYVAPSGARAASAGTYILYASHVAAMAPATNLGAATPVSIGGEPAPAPPEQKQSGDEHRPADRKLADERDARSASRSEQKPAAGTDQGSGSGSDSARQESAPAPSSAMERKVVNDAAAYIRGLAELRGRNVEWAEQAVRGAASLSANDALEKKVIDVVARDIPDLLAQIDGREVRLGNSTVKLATRGLSVAYAKPDWRIGLLSVITHPTIAYGLLLIGIYGLLFEGYNPGAVFPGVVGAISLLIALFAFQILSVNYAGLALVAVGVGMIVAEFFFPAFGSLGLGGLIAFIVGSLILFDSDVPGMQVGRPLIAALATAGAIVIGGIVYLASRAMSRPVTTGVAGMIGASAEVFEDFIGSGRVRYGGELWNAHSDRALHAGQTARIVRVEGLTLWVEPQ